MPRLIIMTDFFQNKIDITSKQKTLLVDCTLMSTSRSLNASLVTSPPPISQLSSQISTRSPRSPVVFSERNATALTQETRSIRNPEKFFSDLQKFVK